MVARYLERQLSFNDVKVFKMQSYASSGPSVKVATTRVR